MRTLTRTAACAFLLAAGACSQSSAPANPRLWTLFTDQALSAADAGAVAANDGVPAGIPLDLILSGPTLVERTALADGQPVTFLTTEVWANYPQVWMQPAYVPITGWAADGTPIKLVDPAIGWHPIFSVGPPSGFYSPFWQIVYFQVPAGTAPDAVTSARQVLDGAYPLTPSNGRTMPLVPDSVMGGGEPGTAAFKPAKGWLNGASVSFLDFGSGTFSWDPANNVVQAAPIYLLTLTGSDGAQHTSRYIPTILGVAQPGAGNAGPLVVNGQQRFWAYWRVNTFVLPPGARVFAPPGSPVAQDLGPNVSTGTYTAAVLNAASSDYEAYEGQVALDPGDPSQGVAGCFDDPAQLPGCNWLNSETQLQANLDPSGIAPTATSVSWEVIGVNGAPVEVLP